MHRDFSNLRSLFHSTLSRAHDFPNLKSTVALTRGPHPTHRSAMTTTRVSQREHGLLVLCPVGVCLPTAGPCLPASALLHSPWILAIAWVSKTERTLETPGDQSVTAVTVLREALGFFHNRTSQTGKWTVLGERVCPTPGGTGVQDIPGSSNSLTLLAQE